MKLAVFGATGRLGRELVEQSLRAGHGVRALARRPVCAGLPDQVEVIAGDILQAEAVDAAIDGADAVLSCLGAKLHATFVRGGRIAAPGVREIIEAMYWRGTRRLVAVSTYGAGASFRQLTPGARLLMRALLWGELADKNAMEAAITSAPLDWTIVRPVNLTNGASAGWSEADPSMHVGLRDSISRRDVAGFMLAALDDPISVRRAVVLTSRPRQSVERELGCHGRDSASSRTRSTSS